MLDLKGYNDIREKDRLERERFSVVIAVIFIILTIAWISLIV